MNRGSDTTQHEWETEREVNLKSEKLTLHKLETMETIADIEQGNQRIINEVIMDQRDEVKEQSNWKTEQ